MAQPVQHDLAKLVLPIKASPQGVPSNDATAEHATHFARRLTKPAFETGAESHAEANKRALLLSSSAVPGASRLAAKLTCDDGEDPAVSLAHPVYMRMFRRVIGSELLISIHQTRAAGLRVNSFTLVWLEHAVAAAALLRFDPAPPIAWLRRIILKHLPRNARGWLYAQLHGEYEAKSGTFVIHFHGIAAGDYLAALDGPMRQDLKDQLKAKLDALPTLTTDPKVRVVLKVAKLQDTPRQVSYVLQSWWPSRPMVMTPRGWKRVRAKGRIPEPHHTNYLLWLDQQSISGLRLRMGLGSGG